MKESMKKSLEENVEQSRENEMKDFSGLRFLITEDNALSADIMAELLTLRHATVCCVRSGEEAVRLLQEEKGTFDAVLMDVHMPGMDGYETTRAIRALGRRRAAHVPVLAMTASTDERDRRHAMEAGMDAYLTKPLEMAALDRALRKVLSAAAG